MRRRVAVVTFWDPWEAPHGGTLRTRAFCEAFARAGRDVVCIFPASPTSVAGTVDGVERVPVAGQTHGHRRWPASLQRLKRLFLPLPTAAGARSGAIREALARLGTVDVLAVSQLSAVPYHEMVPGAALWLDQSDVWSEVARRDVAARRGPARRTAEAQRRALVTAEARAIERSAVITAAGWHDANLLRERTGAAVIWCPTPVGGSAVPVPRTGDPTPTAGFFANFAYLPNVDALDALAVHWLAPLRDRGWRVVVAGLGDRPLALPPGIEDLGEVASPADFYAAVDVTLAPIRLGGGMKVKVIESLRFGRPVLATPFAVEGFPPAVRDLTLQTSLQDPHLDDLDELATRRAALPEDLDRAFTIDAFSERVAGALDGVLPSI